MLECRGVHAQFPTRDVRHKLRDKMITRKLPMISRVIYAQFRAAPQWDVMKSRLINTGVYCHGTTPIEIPYNVVRAVMGLPTIAEELEAARRDMLRVTDGCKAELMVGPMAGFFVAGFVATPFFVKGVGASNASPMRRSTSIFTSFAVQVNARAVAKGNWLRWVFFTWRVKSAMLDLIENIQISFDPARPENRWLLGIASQRATSV